MIKTRVFERIFSSKKAVEDISNSGRICILDIEIKGVRTLRKLGVDAKYIQVRAPSIDELVSAIFDNKPSISNMPNY